MIQNKKLLLKIVFGIAVSVMLILIVSLQLRIQLLEEEKVIMEDRLTDYRIIVEEMEYNMNLPREEYIEKYAREVLGYHKFSDIIIKSESDG